MAHKINSRCVVCNFCVPVCPVNAIKIGEDIYEIKKKKCVDCKGFFNEPQCYVVCPVNAIESIKE
jgi:ferredoxin